jgi:hypothetical protein
MNQRTLGHGCLSIIVCLGTGPALADGSEVAQARTRVFDLHYEVDRASLPIESVALWYASDGGRSWHQYGFDEDRRSPMAFTAPTEGAYGFYFVVTNRSGVSGPPPDATTTPHARAFVDFTPPVVQIYPPRTAQTAGQRVVQIRWTAIDANLDARPIRLEFRRPSAETWTPVADAPITNTGRYDWRVPVELTGPIAVRVSVTDRGGHHASAETRVFEAPPKAAPGPETGVGKAPTAASPSIEDVSRALNLYREAVGRREGGERRMAVSLLRESISLNPQFTEALVALGETYVDARAFDPARSAFDLALRQNPTLRGALRGSARLDMRADDYASAAGRLRMIVERFPDDAEAWMDLGDVAIYQGDDVSARDFYQRAATVEPSASSIVEAARTRLDLLLRSSRTYEEEKR